MDENSMAEEAARAAMEMEEGGEEEDMAIIFSKKSFEGDRLEGLGFSFQILERKKHSGAALSSSSSGNAKSGRGAIGATGSPTTSEHTRYISNAGSGYTLAAVERRRAAAAATM